MEFSRPHTRFLEQIAVAADALRGRILLVLDRQEVTVSELCDVVQVPQSTVSRHLKVLSDAGWVTSRREGTRRLYSLASDDLTPALRQVWLVLREELAGTPAAAQDDHRLAGVLAARRTASQEFFSSAAGQWDRLRNELFGPDSHLRFLPGLLDETSVIGDLGCGTGHTAEALAPFVAQVIAVDASPEMLEAARVRLAGASNVEFRQGLLEQLPIDDRTLDAAVLALVLHHVAEPQRVCLEAARVLKPGGRLVLVEMLPHEHEEYRQTMGHVWLGFPPQQVARWLSLAGFDAVRVRALQPAPAVRGPALFVASAVRAQPVASADREAQSRNELVVSS